jgi:hypothetical protein
VILTGDTTAADYESILAFICQVGPAPLVTDRGRLCQVVEGQLTHLTGHALITVLAGLKLIFTRTRIIPPDEWVTKDPEFDADWRDDCQHRRYHRQDGPARAARHRELTVHAAHARAMYELRRADLEAGAVPDATLAGPDLTAAVNRRLAVSAMCPRGGRDDQDWAEKQELAERVKAACRPADEDKAAVQADGSVARGILRRLDEQAVALLDVTQEQRLAVQAEILLASDRELESCMWLFGRLNDEARSLEGPAPACEGCDGRTPAPERFRDEPAMVGLPVAALLAARTGSWGNVTRAAAVENFGYARFLAAWMDAYGPDPVRSADLMPLAGRLLLDPPKNPMALAKLLARLAAAGLVRKSPRSAQGSTWTPVADAVAAIST